MRKTLAAVLLCLSFATPALADGLSNFLSHLNVQAKADMSGFTAKISAQFGVPEAQVKVVLGQVSKPADAFMVFQLSQMSQQQPAAVLQTYQANRNRGWGRMAQDLGIRPGSAAFFALKRGDLRFDGQPMDSADEGPGNPGRGHGHGHGHGRGHGRDRGGDDD